MAMTRRGFLKRLGIGAGAFVTSAALAKEAEALFGVSGEIDYERALWLPGTKSIVDLGAQAIVVPDDATVSRVLEAHGRVGLPRFVIETRGRRCGESRIYYDSAWNAVKGTVANGAAAIRPLTAGELDQITADMKTPLRHLRWDDGAYVPEEPRFAETIRESGWPTMPMADAASEPYAFTEYLGMRKVREVKKGEPS